MQITAKDTADFYNSLFFDEAGNLVEPEVSILIEHEGQQLIIPKAKVSAKMEFHKLILDFHRQLEKDGPLELSQAPESKPMESALIDFKRIEYRNNIYFVEQIGKEEFRVLNEERTKEISLKSPTAKGILRRFRDGNN
ncbi:MAG: hypothetical protein KDC85_21970 [Saprospiraceae bacterium]|nr:hypothetical protein [Saprospiraceae bacterium]MCB9322880.1 hypothetical protein [Lewinellaceae bacterium]